jgi:glycosyltransferase involved in cell wall biosynthesis
VIRKILYIAPSKSSFVQKDLEILKEEFNVEFISFQIRYKWFLPLALFNLFTQLLFKKYHCVICMFAGYHSSVPVFLKRIKKWKTIIIAGGTDCVSFPSINYGYFQNALIKPFLIYSFKNTDAICPVHDALVYQEYNYNNEGLSAQGIKAFITDLKTKIKTIHNGYNATIFNFSTIKNKNTVVTIGADFSLPFSEQLKGIDLFIETATYFPKTTFYIVGGENKIKSEAIPNNIKFTPFIPNHQLADFLKDKTYYFQLSLSEGFPNALCEAMLCGCIPLVSKVGGMPSIVNNTGYILEKKDINLLVQLFTRAQQEYQPTQHIQARKQIENNYTVQKRQTELISFIKELTK